jgi:CDP-6-deoxy-D-xylo-4-hexulose-3-dehydrase
MEINISDIFPKIEKIVSKRFEKVKSCFIPGKTYIPSSSHNYDDREVNAAIRVLLSGKWNDGLEACKFEQAVAYYNSRRCGALCNSGSSANLLALASTMSHKNGERRLRVGQEVITSLVGFPTTLNAILQLGLTPVFVDCEIPTYNANPCLVEEAVGKNTGAILLAHTLGNPVSISYIEDNAIAGSEIWFILDNCDGGGGTYTGTFAGRPLGSYGDMSTLSFYPAHQISCVEGGMVLTDSPMTNSIIRSLRDWGRQCFCKPGVDNTCGKRFAHEYESLPVGYDHKYVYSEIGYNLKSTDIQAAIGNEQIKRLPAFVKTRRKNWKFYHDTFKAEGLDEYFILPEPHRMADPAWFGFALTLRDKKMDRTDFTQYLESKKVGTRNLFGGNLLRQPAYKDIPHKLVGTTKNADVVTERTFWIGVSPNITREMQEYVVDVFKKGIK